MTLANSSELETLAVRIVEDAVEAALLFIEDYLEQQQQQPGKNENHNNTLDLLSSLIENMDTAVATPRRKSSLSSFQNKQLKEGRKLSVTFNVNLIQEFVIEEFKPKEEKPEPVKSQDPEDDDDEEEVTKL